MSWTIPLGVLLLCCVGDALNKGSVFLAEIPIGSPGVTLQDAAGYCTNTYGPWAETACWQNVQDTWNIGLDLCNYAWLNDGTMAQPIRAARDGCSAVGVSKVSPRELGGTFGVWCYVGRQVECGSVGQFSCGNGLCVPHWARCDGVNNCGDNSDEQQCGGVFLYPALRSGPAVSFWNASQACQASGARVAGWRDLAEQWAKGLDICRRGWLQDATTAHVVHKTRDGCGKIGLHHDGSYGTWSWNVVLDVWCKALSASFTCESVSQYTCNNLNCVPTWAMCDGVDNCGDFSDELPDRCRSAGAQASGDDKLLFSSGTAVADDGGSETDWIFGSERQAFAGASKVVLVTDEQGEDRITFLQASDRCSQLGMQLASWEDLRDSWNAGLDLCRNGWLSDGTIAHPIHTSREVCTEVGVNHEGSHEFTEQWNVWCSTYGMHDCTSINQFSCANGLCVPHWANCDGVNNCGDNSDEQHCGHVFMYPGDEAAASVTFWDAATLCQGVGATVASWEDLYNAYSLGLDICRYAWLNDGTISHPIRTIRDDCGQVGVNHDGSHEYSSGLDVWCQPKNGDFSCDSVNQFTCNNGLCVPYWVVCDSIDNCGDNSEEEDCGHVFLYPGNQLASSVNFMDAKARCASVGARLASYEDLSFTWRHGLDICRYGWLEDGTISHPIHTAREGCGEAGINHDGSHEYTEGFDVWCEPKTPKFKCLSIGQFKCDNHLCIPFWLKCDGIDNCGDNSDENCDGTEGPGEVKITSSTYAYLYEGDLVFDAELDTDLFMFLEVTDKCAKYDSTVATWEDLKEAWDVGLDLCVHGWLNDATIAQPIHYPREVCDTEGVDHLGSLEYSSKFHIWCRPDTFVVCEKINQFGCKNTLCVPYWARCDGVNNCGDNSDEEHCGYVFLWPGLETDTSGQVRFWDAEKSCQTVGAKLASWEDMYNTFNVGLDICRMAWLSDSTTVHPIHTARDGCGDVGIVHYGNHEYHTTFEVWCEPVMPDFNCKKIGQFSCDNGLCVPQWLVCNGINNCGDNSDERCDNTGLVTFLMPSQQDQKYLFMYKDAAAVCDAVNAVVATSAQLSAAWNIGLDICRKGWLDGGDLGFPLHYPRVTCQEDYGSISEIQKFAFPNLDEQYDVYCTFKDPSSTCDDVEQFTCNNKLCVPFWLKCDGINNCGDNSDEDDCAPKLVCTDDLAENDCSLLLQLFAALLQDIQAELDRLSAGGGGEGTAPDEALNRLDELSAQLQSLRNLLAGASSESLEQLRDAINEANTDATRVDNEATVLAQKGSTENGNADTANQRAADLDAQIKALNARLDEMKSQLGAGGTDDGSGPSSGDIDEARNILAEIEGRKTNNVNFEPNKNDADSEKTEADKLDAKVKDWLKSSGPTGTIVSLESKTTSFNQQLNDMGDAIDRANQMADQADLLNKANADRPDKSLLDNAEAQGGDMKNTVDTAASNLEEAKKAFEEAKARKANIDGHNDKITEGRAQLQSKVDSLGDLDALAAKVKEAEDHAMALKNRETEAQILKESGGDLTQKALQAIRAYEGVVSKIDEAEEAAKQALQAAQDAKQLVDDGNFKATARRTKQDGDASLQKAKDQRSSLKNDLKPRLDAADTAVTDVEAGLQAGRDQLATLTSELNKLESPDPPIDQAKLTKAGKRTSDAKSVVDDVISGQYATDQGLSGQWKSVKELEDAAATGGAGGGNTGDIDSMLNDVSANIARINALRLELEGTISAKSTEVNNVKGSIEEIRRMVREARAAANGINNVPMNFGGNTAARLDTRSQPLINYFSDNRNQFSMSMAVKPDADGTLLFIGDPNNANSDYIGLEVVNGFLRASYNLNNGANANNFFLVNQNQLTAGQWQTVRMERFGNFLKLFVGDQEGNGASNNNYILFDMPQNGGLWLGGVPSGSTLPSGMSLSGRGFRGNIDDLKFGDPTVPASGLWNFREAYNLLSPGTVPSRERSLSEVTSANVLFFDGVGYGHTREEITVDIGKRGLQLFSAYIRPGGQDGLIYFYGDQNLYFAVELRNNKLVVKIKLPAGEFEVETSKTIPELLTGDYIQMVLLLNLPRCGTMLFAKDRYCVDVGTITPQQLTMRAQVGGLDSTLQGQLAGKVTDKRYRGCIKQLQVEAENRQIVHIGSVASVTCPVLIRSLEFSGIDSYLRAKWPSVETVYQNFEATFTFQTSAANGVMLLAKGAQGVLWAISMSNGNVIFAAFGDNANAGALRVTSQNAYNDGNEHYILVRRVSRDLFMQLDDNLNIPRNSNLNRGTFSTDQLILGGPDPATKNDLTPGNTQLVDNTGHFQGCIKNLIFANNSPNDGLVDFLKADDRNNVIGSGTSCASG